MVNDHLSFFCRCFCMKEVYLFVYFCKCVLGTFIHLAEVNEILPEEIGLF